MKKYVPPATRLRRQSGMQRWTLCIRVVECQTHSTLHDCSPAQATTVSYTFGLQLVVLPAFDQIRRLSEIDTFAAISLTRLIAPPEWRCHAADRPGVGTQSKAAGIDPSGSFNFKAGRGFS